MNVNDFVFRESLSETIITDLSNYRHKRIMGLAGMFGDHLLTRMLLDYKVLPFVKMKVVVVSRFFVRVKSHLPKSLFFLMSTDQMSYTKQCEVMISTLSHDLKQCL